MECLVSTNVGLAAGRYSGTSLPDLYLTPHALQRVFGPMGPVRHCGVLSVAQWRHFRPSPLLPMPAATAAAAAASFFFGAAVFFPELDVVMSDSEDDEMAGAVVAVLSTEGERDTKRRDVQLHGAAARERLLRALAGTAAAISGLKVVAGLDSGWKWWVWDWDWDDSSSFPAFIPEISCSFCKSSLENDSSTKFDSHSSSATSSYCNQIIPISATTYITSILYYRIQKLCVYN